MRRITTWLIAVGVLTAMALQGWAGAEVDDIIARAIKAHSPKGGGDKNQAYRGKNKGTLFVAGLELEFTQDIWLNISAGKFKEVMELTVMGNQVRTSTVYNGKDAWLKVNEMEIPIKEELLDEFKEMSYMMRVGQLTGLKDKDVKFSLIGEAQVNGKPAWGVRISKEGKKDLSLYFDKESGLMAKTEHRARDFQSGQEVTEERIITAYQDVDGRKVAKQVTVVRDSKKLLEAVILEAKLLEKLDDSEFAKP